MAAHSSDHAWRIPGTVEPGGLPSMGSHRVRHDWSDLAAAAAVSSLYTHNTSPLIVWQATVWGKNYCLYSLPSHPWPLRSLVNCHFQVCLILHLCRLRNHWMDLAFEVWGCGGNCCQVTGSGATLWAIALVLLFPFINSAFFSWWPLWWIIATFFGSYTASIWLSHFHLFILCSRQ